MPENTQQPQEQPKAPATKEAQAQKKNKKINAMSLAELEAKLKEVKEKMGSLQSSYAKQLLKQKDALLKTKG